MASFPKISNFASYLPAFLGGSPKSPKHISRTIAPNQFLRYKHDIQSWKDAITEMEQATYPFRVKAQRIYMDTVLNGHVDACLNRRYNLTLLKDFGFFNGEVENEEVSELFRTKWFFELMKYGLEARFYGYSLIEFGDLVNNAFPDLRLVIRENISPDRRCVSRFTYGIQGEEFDNPESEYYNWTAYIDSPSDKGTSICGYGLLYKIAGYEILLRNLLGANANYNDLFGQPIRWAKSAKLEGKEYDALAQAMDEMGQEGWIITDPMDEIELIESKSGAQGYKTYGDFEKRLEQKISKVILGHADALDSVPGKLGGGQGDKSPVSQALEDLETIDSRFLEYFINDIIIPKLIVIGFPIPVGLVFKFKNDKEIEEIESRENDNNKLVSDIFKTIKDAGGDPDWKYFKERTGITVEKTKEVETNIQTSQSVTNKLDRLYGKL